MNRTIFCHKLQKEAEGLAAPPFPGALGDTIYQTISKEAWNMWLLHQTMLINEYRLSLMDAQSRTFLKDEMNKFFFGEGSHAPTGFTPIT
jgi:Fe-S cluster biosynthesis and repair protein YggX